MDGGVHLEHEEEEAPGRTGRPSALFDLLDELYNGATRRAENFRLGMLVLDIFAITLFVIESFINFPDPYHITEFVIGTIYALDYLARFSVHPERWRFAVSITGLADLIVIISLLAPPLVESHAFLRALRALRILRSYRALAHLRDRYSFFRRNEDVVAAVVNLFVFIFIVTALVYITQHEHNPQISNYLDALYFSVTALSTTGFGDITLQGTSGRILAVVIMIFGISLFLRLIQTLFRPSKVHSPCPSCGLIRHEPDAVHCKHCGAVVNIPAEGG